MFPSAAQGRHPNSFWTIFLLCLSYLIFQLINIPSTALSVDEFWFAHHIFEYTHKLPYRDFLPYKTILGYYLFSAPFFIWHTFLQPVYYIKYEIAIINTFFLGGVTFWLMRFFNPRTVIFSTILILANNLFLIYSVELRIDMLASWLGLISILFILSNRVILAGTAIAISFLISQKALWFFAATNFAFVSYWILISRNWQMIRKIFQFNLAVLIPVFVYVVIWSIPSNLHVVLNSVFYEAFSQSKITWYTKIYYRCWSVILSNGPLLILLWPFTWIMFFTRTHLKTSEYQRRFFITAYAGILMLCVITYQQAFPYGMVLIIPAYFLIYSDFFSWTSAVFQEKYSLNPLNHRGLFWFIALYTIGTTGLIIFMGLSFAYYLILLIPLSVFILPYFKDILRAPLLVIMISTGIVYPMVRVVYKVYLFNGNYQKSMLTVSNELLKDGGGFFAGTPLFYDRDQAISGLKNLIDPAIEYLRKPSEKILPIMLASLYLEPRTDAEVIHDLQVTPVKFYVNSNRIWNLPNTIHRYLQTEFTHYWGSIYIYAPVVARKKQNVLIKFRGNYEVVAKEKAIIYLDNKKILPNSVISLQKGWHISDATIFYRLKYVPNHPVKLDPEYAADDSYKFLKLIVA